MADPDLQTALLAAHARRDHDQLITLYAQAADNALQDGRDEAADFYLTHAYVFALERGDTRARQLHAQLKARGREE